MKVSARANVQAALLVCVVALVACRADIPAAVNRPEAEFGIFFGAQIQQRQDIPLEPDESRQQQGFRIRFAKPTLRPLTVSWEVDYPTARTGTRGPGNAGRAQRKESTQLPTGVDRFEQKLTLSIKDIPGTWNIRVLVENEVVLDRPFRLVTTRSGGR